VDGVQILGGYRVIRSVLRVTRKGRNRHAARLSKRRGLDRADTDNTCQ